MNGHDFPRPFHHGPVLMDKVGSPIVFKVKRTVALVSRRALNAKQGALRTDSKSGFTSHKCPSSLLRPPTACRIDRKRSKHETTSTHSVEKFEI